MSLDSSSPSSFQIFLNDNTQFVNRTYIFTINDKTTVSSFKDLVYAKTGIPPTWQSLSYSTVHFLNSDRTLCSYGVKNLANITLNISSTFAIDSYETNKNKISD